MNSLTYVKPIFGNEAALSECGSKCINLARLSSITTVPRAYCLTPRAFLDSIPGNCAQIIESLLTTLKSNGGYQLTRIQKEISLKLENIKLSRILLQELALVFQWLAANPDQRVIVRSSSPFEDTPLISGAGIYESIGSIETEEAFVAAIVICWKSFFSLSALAHRLRLKEYDLRKPPALVLQEYIEPIFSGVTFTEDPISQIRGALIEYVDSFEGTVEAGTGHSKRVKIVGEGDSLMISNSDLPTQVIDSNLATLEKLRHNYAIPMEFEWLYRENQFYVVQARPITSHGPQKNSDSIGQLGIFNSYDDYNFLTSDELGEVTEIYHKSINKRKPIRDLAVQNGVKVHGVIVLKTNVDHCMTFDVYQCHELNRIKSPLLVVDIGPHIRAFYTQRSEINQTLRTLLKHTVGQVAVIIREFASGEFSCISSLADEKCIIEVCRGSLIGLNRGFVATNTFQVNLNSGEIQAFGSKEFPARYYGFSSRNKCFEFMESDEAISIDAVPREALLKIASFTQIAHNVAGGISLEWTILNGEPVFIDHTLVDGGKMIGNFKIESDGPFFLSHGNIEGTVHRVQEIDKLEYISSGPTLNVKGHIPTMQDNKEIIELLEFCSNTQDLVIVSKHPYTAFSVIIDEVNGFIFESGPLLCHLSIVCRERGVPIAIVANALSKYEDGEHVKL